MASFFEGVLSPVSGIRDTSITSFFVVVCALSGLGYSSAEESVSYSASGNIPFSALAITRSTTSLLYVVLSLAIWIALCVVVSIEFRSLRCQFRTSFQFLGRFLVASSYATLAGAPSGSLCRCPNHLSLFSWMGTDQGIVWHIWYRSVFFYSSCPDNLS